MTAADGYDVIVFFSIVMLPIVGGAWWWDQRADLRARSETWWANRRMAARDRRAAIKHMEHVTFVARSFRVPVRMIWTPSERFPLLPGTVQNPSDPSPTPRHRHA